MSTAVDILHENDEGTELGVIIKDEDGSIVDVSAASVMQLKFLKEGGATATETAVHKTDGTDGHIIFVTTAGWLTPPGNWYMRGYVELPSGKWHTSYVQFVVRPLDWAEVL